MLTLLPDCEASAIARVAMPRPSRITSAYDIEQLVVQKSHPIFLSRVASSQQETRFELCFSCESDLNIAIAALHGFKTSIKDIPFEFSCTSAQRRSSTLRAQLAHKATLFDRLAPGQRPDTLVLHQLPYRWVGVAQLNTVLEAPTSELIELLQSACQWSSSDALAAVRRVEATVNSADSTASDVYIQFNKLTQISSAAEALAGRLLKLNKGGFVCRLHVEVDKSAYLSDKLIAARAAEREQRRIKAERLRIEQERQRLIAEAAEKARIEREEAERAAAEAAEMARRLAEAAERERIREQQRIQEAQRIQREMEERHRLAAEHAARLEAEAAERNRLAEEKRVAEAEKQRLFAEARAAEVARLRAEALVNIERLEARRSEIERELQSQVEQKAKVAAMRERALQSMRAKRVDLIDADRFGARDSKRSRT